ncbi:fungal specific transcription factor [Diaporthe amygdali]|uniref:fungal specific transcription factor n=1 Tax=Phomopsis amygdali TaxID=1214568 RepID=UPI0022FDBDA9|nr:fungal specific transcription factor [Diaporthe amygdali]KAJ0117440.1 fungal specific transcription factor [Diaporthe amygdali]
MAEPPQKRPVKFVASDQDGLPVKRRQVQQACDPYSPGPRFFADASHQKSIYAHLQADPQQPDGSGSNRSGTLPNSPQSPEQNSGASSTREVASQLIELSTSRFVGDLSPESIFLEATSKIARDPSRRNTSDIGTWLPVRRSDDDSNVRRQSSVATQDEPAGSQSAQDGPISFRTLSGRLPPSTGSPEHHDDGPQSRDRGGVLRPSNISAVCPPDEDYHHLYAIYLDRFQTMWPILREADAISLATSVETCASRYLRLDSGGPILSVPDFQRPLFKALLSFLDEQVLTDRTDHIRALFLAFFYQPTRASEQDLPALIFSQAVHYSQSIGIHLVGSGVQDERSKEAETLYCALWALDRMNAAFHGRPCLLHEQDTDRVLNECIAAQKEPGFRLLLSVVTMLDKVICLYRPRSKEDDTVVLPVFESMIMDAGADKIAPWMHSSIEIFYHAISILSCRQPSSAFAPSAPAQAHLPHPNINARRSLSADRIVDSVTFAMSFPTSPDRITITPFVPYALALSLSVSYRKMRYSKIPLYRLRGKTRFKEVVALLKRLGDIFTCARVNAGLGEAILQEMDKTTKGLVNSGAAGVANGTTPSPTDARPASRRALPAEVTLGSKRNVYVRETDKQPPGSIAATPRSTHTQTGESPLQQLPTPRLQQAPGRPSPAPLNTAPDEGVVAAQQPSSSQALPATALGDMLDVDIFGHFDPGFDLNTVDAALSANLDMGFPQMWTTPWQNWPS